MDRTTYSLFIGFDSSEQTLSMFSGLYQNGRNNETGTDHPVSKCMGMSGGSMGGGKAV
jgi:hypothetical protein